MFKRDQYTLGILISIGLPVLAFALIFLINYLLIQVNIVSYYLDVKSHFLLSIAVNTMPLRYYFVNLKFDKTGRGVLLATFVLVMLFFALNDRLMSFYDLMIN